MHTNNKTFIQHVVYHFLKCLFTDIWWLKYHKNAKGYKEVLLVNTSCHHMSECLLNVTVPKIAIS